MSYDEALFVRTVASSAHNLWVRAQDLRAGYDYTNEVDPLLLGKLQGWTKDLAALLEGGPEIS